MGAVQHTCPACVARSVGSTNLTSDLDVTVSGPDTARFVAEFNRRFRAEFGAESGDVFDTQVYGASFVGPGRATSGAYVSVRVNGAEFRALAPFRNERVRAQDEYNQHVWAACKLALYASAPELDLLAARLRDHSDYWVRVLSDARDMLAADRPSEPETLAPSNRKYERALAILNRARVAMEARPADERLRLAYKNAVSRANYYASESYFSQGPFVDVVMNTQSGARLPVTRAEYLDSYLENMGDMLKVIGHAEGENCVRNVVDMSKYWSRALQACGHVQSAVPEALIRDTEFLRKNARGRAMEDLATVRATVSEIIARTAHACSRAHLRGYVVRDVLVTLTHA